MRVSSASFVADGAGGVARPHPTAGRFRRDRKSTRLNSSHGYISYAVFCLKKKKLFTIVVVHRNRPPTACERFRACVPTSPPAYGDYRHLSTKFHLCSRTASQVISPASSAL